ncbi:MAG: fibronectin type III domain-containing protein, partial [Planctomycetia bacterium]|nr:fibronectin type III domain-containing protein [Planctomycetia bacterium]
MDNMEKKTQNRTAWNVRGEKKERRITRLGNRTERLLRMEPLEQRELLAVSFAEYNQIRELYSGFELAADWEQVHIVDLEELSRDALCEAVSLATSSQGDDLIVVRTSQEAASIALGDETLDIDYDADQFGTLTIIGWGDTLLELTGRTTLVNVSAGDVQLGAMQLTVQGTVATDADFEFLASDSDASLSTSRMLYVRDSQAQPTVQASTEAGSNLFSASAAGTQSPVTGYYSVEFQLTRTDDNPTESKWAYVTGLDLSGVEQISTALAGGYGSIDPLSVIGGKSGYYVDAEKSDAPSDSDLCWAATASNMLWYSGWANSDMTPSFSSEDSVLDYFKSYWPNVGGNIGTGNSWFLNGYSGINGGALHNDVNYGSIGGSMAITGGMKFANMVEKLRADNAIGLSVGWFLEGPGEVLTTRYYGHAITLWGYVYDKAYTAGTPEYYSACIIADSDDNKYSGTNAPNVLCSCDLIWDSMNSEYCFKSYKSGGCYGWLETFYWLVPNTPLAHKPQLARTTISLSTKTQTNTATVECQISQIDNAVSYTLEYSPTAAFAAGETFSRDFTYAQTNYGVYTVEGLSPGTLYYFRVKCVGNGVDYRDSEWSATKSITTETAKTPLATPMLTMVSSDNNSVTLSLSTVANAAGYRVWFSTNQNDFSTTSAYTFNQSGTQTLYGLKAGTTWYFQAAALGDGQLYSDSARSITVSQATTGAASSDDRTKGNIVTTLLDVVDANDGLISLREAISYCGNYGTTTNITFVDNLRGGTITLSALNNLSTKTTSLLITKSLTITGITGEGDDTSPAITIDGNGTNKVFYFYNTKSDGTQQTNSISNLVVTGGALQFDHDGYVHGGGGIEVLRTTLTISNCVVAGNVLESSGNGASSLSMYGAGIYARDSKLVVQDSIISDNAISISGQQTAYLYGAGIASTGNAANSALYPASLTLIDSIVEKNTMTGRSTIGSIFAFGAAISNSGSSVLSVSDCNISSNHVTVNMENTVAVIAGQLSANVRGGAVYNDSTGDNQINRTIIQNNTASAQAVSDSVQVVAGVYGTGLHNAGTLVVSNTLIADNSARGQAASENENEFAQVYGTALYVGDSGTLDLIGSTISGNEASVSAVDSETILGTLYVDTDVKARVYNSIIARNFAAHGGD